MTNQVIEALLTRRSVRSYTKEPVSRELLEQIVECGRYAATARGIQPWHFTVVTDRGLLERMSRANGAIMAADPGTPDLIRATIEDGSFDTFRGAPCAVIVSGRTDARFATADCANAVENMALAAHSLGLGSCYLASHSACLMGEAGAALRQELGIPEGYSPDLALAIGHPAGPAPEAAARGEGQVNWVE